MASIRQIFTLEYANQEESEQFYKFMENNCETLFSDIGNVRYTVPYLLMKSVINAGRPDGKGAKHRGLYKETMELLNNKEQTHPKYANYHKSTIIQMIHDEAGGSYQRFTNLLKKYIRDSEIADFQFRKVKYGYEDNFFEYGHYIL